MGAILSLSGSNYDFKKSWCNSKCQLIAVGTLIAILSCINFFWSRKLTHLNSKVHPQNFFGKTRQKVSIIMHWSQFCRVQLKIQNLGLKKVYFYTKFILLNNVKIWNSFMNSYLFHYSCSIFSKRNETIAQIKQWY